MTVFGNIAVAAAAKKKKKRILLVGGIGFCRGGWEKNMRKTILEIKKRGMKKKCFKTKNLEGMARSFFFSFLEISKEKQTKKKKKLEISTKFDEREIPQLN